jgi:hypothetical protein
MGLFGGKETYVSSVVYNMAGGLEDRIDFLKSVVNGSIIGNTGFSMAECLTGSYLSGPGIKIRTFHRWVRDQHLYDAVGVPTIRTISSYGYDIDLIATQLPTAGETERLITKVDYGSADYTYWADQYVLANEPNLFNTAWTANMVGGDIVITWADTTTTTFTPSGYDTDHNYFYVAYDRRASGSMLQPLMWIYRVGDGNTVMDEQATYSTSSGEFVTFIPIRMGSEFISDTHLPDVYAQTKRAYKKASGGKKLSKLVEIIADNDDIDDIDRAYLVYGVALNTKDNAARKYLFKFFDNMRTLQLYDNTAVDTYYSTTTTFNTAATEAANDRNVFLVDAPIEDQGSSADPGYTYTYTPPPTEPITEIEIRSHGTYDANLHLVVRWKSIKKVTGSGLGKVGAKVGEVWWEDLGYYDGATFVSNMINEVVQQSQADNHLDLYWQKSATEWEKLEFIGLKHRNIIKNDKAVKISAEDALADEDESGFIVPIHYDTLKEMSLVDSTQMMTSAAYLVFNCYEVVKQKWYETWAFKIFIFIVVIVVCVMFPPLGGPMAAGLLGTAAAVGATLGFTGLMAAIVGAIANAIAAMILMSIISKVSVAVFGAKFGLIIATIASFVAMSFGVPLLNGASMATAWGGMMSAVNLLGLTAAVGNGVSGYLQASAASMAAQTQQVITDYKHDSNEISRKWLEQFGYGSFAFDPNQLTNNNPNGLSEPPQMFLDRTLMCGSDIADMSLNMITDFAKMTLTPATTGS